MLTPIWVMSSPLRSMSTRVDRTLDGAGKKRVSMTPKRAHSSHTISRPSGEMTLSRRSRVRADIFAAAGGAVDMVCTLMIRLQLLRLDLFRLLLFRLFLFCLFLGSRALHLLAQARPDMGDQLAIFRRLLQLHDIAGPRQRNRHEGLHLAGLRGHHHDAVAEKHRLVDRMGDENHGLLVLFPDAQQLLLQ